MTSTRVLEAIKGMNSRQKELNGRQNYSHRPISIDTLMLALKISEADLMPLIEELQSFGEINYHQTQALKLAHIKRLGSVSLKEI